MLILAISSNLIDKLDFEEEIEDWKAAGLLKASIFKSAVATIEKTSILTKVGSLSERDKSSLKKMIETIC